MGLFKRKKKSKRKPIKDDLSEKIESRIYMDKKEIYTVPGVDRVSYQKETVKKKIMIRPTSYICPKCKTRLQNVKLDGVHFYCPKCEVHHHWSKL